MSKMAITLIYLLNGTAVSIFGGLLSASFCDFLRSRRKHLIFWCGMALMPASQDLLVREQCQFRHQSQYKPMVKTFRPTRRGRTVPGIKKTKRLQRNFWTPAQNIPIPFPSICPYFPKMHDGSSVYMTGGLLYILERAWIILIALSSSRVMSGNFLFRFLRYFPFSLSFI